MENLSIDSDNRYGYATVNGKTGVINSSYEWVIEPRYDFIISISENTFKIRIDGKEGVIDLSENILVQPQYEYIGGNCNAEDGMFILKKLRKNNTPCFQLRTEYTLPLSHPYDFLWSQDFNNFVFLENDKLGIYGSKNGGYSEIISAQYDDICAYTDFIIASTRQKEVTRNNEAFSVENVVKYGILDYQNNVIIPLIHNEMKVSESKVFDIPLIERTFFINKGKKSIIINSANKQICDKEFDLINNKEQIEWGDFAYKIYIDAIPYIVDKFGNMLGCNRGDKYLEPFKELNSTESISVCTNNNCKEVINNNGDVLFVSDFEAMNTNENNLIFIKKDGKFGAVDRNNKIIIPFEEGILWGRHDFVVRKNGNYWEPVIWKG